MHPETFDGLARSVQKRLPRRRGLLLLGAGAAGALLGSLSRERTTVRSQEPFPATPVSVETGGAAEEATATEPIDDGEAFDVRTCEQWILSGGVSPADPIHVDDDLTVLLNDQVIFGDADGSTNIFAPIPFGAKNGDQLTAVARDQGSCRKIGALWLHCAAGGEARFLTAGFDDGCDPDRAAPENFYREAWRI